MMHLQCDFLLSSLPCAAVLVHVEVSILHLILLSANDWVGT